MNDLNRANRQEMTASFVLVFFNTKARELRCRVTDVKTNETWVVRQPPALWQLLAERDMPP